MSSQGIPINVQLGLPAVSQITNPQIRFEVQALIDAFSTLAFRTTLKDDNGEYALPSELGSGSGGATKFLREDNTWQLAGGGSGTVNTVTLTAPAAGFSITPSGTAADPVFTFALTDDLAALEALASTGVAKRIGASTWSVGAVSLTADISGILPVVNGGTGTSTPSLVAGTSIGISGTWPNQTVSFTGTAGVSSVFGRSGAVVAVAGDYTFAQIGSKPTTLAGYGITDAALSARLINTTAPLAGGGDLSADRTLTVSAFSSVASGVVPASGGGTTNYLRADGTWNAPPGSGGGVSDGDKGDITVSGSGTVWTIDPDSVTYAKMQNISTTQRVLGRNTAGAGDAEEVSLTQLLDWIGSAQQGDLLVRGLSTWSRLAGVSTGKFLKSSGTPANITWADEAVYNQSVAAQGPGFAADTYLTGSSINVNALLKAGTRYRLVFHVSKTAAGVAAPVITVRFGTAGTTADTARLTFTLLAQTAVIDNGRIELDLTFRNPGASCVVAGVLQIAHALETTGLQTRNPHVVQVTSAAFDTTPANSIIGVSANGGASASWTVQLVQATLENLA